MRIIQRCLSAAALSLLRSTAAVPDVSVKTLYDFGTVARGTTVNADGAAPTTPLVEDAAGNLYGTTSWGGSLGGGTLHEFALVATQTVPIPVRPGSLVIDASGNLYGATSAGGPPAMFLALALLAYVRIRKPAAAAPAPLGSERTKGRE